MGLDSGHRCAQGGRCGCPVRWGEREGGPREVYLRACEAVAGPFVESGFRYARSGQHLTLKQDPWKFRIGFCSSHHNIADKHVALWMGATVWCPSLKKWRLAQPKALSQTDGVGGGQVGNLLPKKSWLEWQLADPGRRSAVIEDIIVTIREIALPYFAQFDDRPRLIEALVEGAIEELSISNAVELLLWMERREDAARAVLKFHEKKPELREFVEPAVTRYQSGEFVKLKNGYAEELVKIRLCYGL